MPARCVLYSSLIPLEIFCYWVCSNRTDRFLWCPWYVSSEHSLSFCLSVLLLSSVVKLSTIVIRTFLQSMLSVFLMVFSCEAEYGYIGIVLVFFWVIWNQKYRRSMCNMAFQPLCLGLGSLSGLMKPSCFRLISLSGFLLISLFQQSTLSAVQVDEAVLSCWLSLQCSALLYLLKFVWSWWKNR